MSLSLRFILPLFLALSLLTFAAMEAVTLGMEHWFVHDVQVRADFVAEAMAPSIEMALRQPDSRRALLTIFQRALNNERLYALAFCSPSGRLAAATKAFPPLLGCSPPAGKAAQEGQVLQIGTAPVHVSYRALPGTGSPAGTLVIVHDLSFLQLRSTEAKHYVFYFFAVLAIVTSFITVMIAQISWRGWVQSIRAVVRRGEDIFRYPSRRIAPEIRPIVKDLRALVREIEQERAVRDESHIGWSPQSLREILQRDLAGEEVLIVSNREPYIHTHRGGQIAVDFPASGLVSALEPVMRACSGTWIAHGSGNADREVVDAQDRVRVPPGEPAYRLRRVWLSEEEERGYYYGLANEGLWPLCHMTHTRPIFRRRDWEMYSRVNRKFAEAVVQEATTENPVVLVQDYHFALLPRMLEKRMPRATVIMFWHIPWPNPEAFGICPWSEEILRGMLGASILGFHTRFHCNNFIESVDRFIEARIDRETNTVTSRGHITAVRQYPISIEWPPLWLEGQPSVADCRRSVREKLGIRPEVKLAIGVDRLDYTKGIAERFAALERLLEIERHWIGRFSLVQIASPSRTAIESYREFARKLRAEADRINRRFSRDSYKPIYLLEEHHTPFDVFRHFRAADVCLVTSLHDGMNLVAKEFVAAREDELGVLILSQFTGASRELPEALIVNPYDTEQCAAALRIALGMGAREQRERMRTMRAYVKEFNIYRWAGRMLLDAALIRQKNRFQERNLLFGT